MLNCSQANIYHLIFLIIILLKNKKTNINSTETIRNKKIVSHEGFQYVFDKNSKDWLTKFYRCRRRDINCKARIHVINGHINRIGDHDGHEESPIAVEVSTYIIY